MTRCQHHWIINPATYIDKKGQQWKHRWCVDCHTNQWSKLIWRRGKHPDQTPREIS